MNDEPTKRIEVDIGAAFAMLQNSPELCAAMNELVGGPALIEAQAEVERLRVAAGPFVKYFEAQEDKLAARGGNAWAMPGHKRLNSIAIDDWRALVAATKARG